MTTTLNIYIRRSTDKKKKDSAESNLKFDNALLRADVHSPGSRELCRGSGDAALRITLHHAQNSDCRCFRVWSRARFGNRPDNFVATRIVISTSIVISRHYRNLSRLELFIRDCAFVRLHYIPRITKRDPSLAVSQILTIEKSFRLDFLLTLCSLIPCGKVSVIKWKDSFGMGSPFS